MIDKIQLYFDSYSIQDLIEIQTLLKVLWEKANEDKGIIASGLCYGLIKITEEKDPKKYVDQRDKTINFLSSYKRMIKQSTIITQPSWAHKVIRGIYWWEPGNTETRFEFLSDALFFVGKCLEIDYPQ